MGVLQQRLDRGPVWLDPVGVPIGPDDRFFLLDQRLQPCRGNLGRAHVRQQRIGMFLRAAQRLVHAQGDPGIALVDVAPDHHGVHDGIDFGAAVIVLLDLGVIGKQPLHLGRAAPERQRIVGAHHEIDLAALEQIAELDAGRRLAQADVRRQLASETVGAALHPLDVARLDAVFVRQQAAHVDRGRHGVFRHAAALALEVARTLDAFVRVDEKVSVTKDARGKHGNGHERRFPGAHQRRVVRQRHFGDFEFLELEHPPEDVGWLRGDIVEVDALGLDGAVAQRKGTVIGSTCECQAQLAHSRSFLADRLEAVETVAQFSRMPALVMTSRHFLILPRNPSLQRFGVDCAVPR